MHELLVIPGKEFLEELLSLPLAEWHRKVYGSPDRVCAELQRSLRRAVGESTTPFNIWFARDNLETLFFRFECVDGRRLLRKTGARARLRRTTDRALLAMIARDHLAPGEFRQLAAEFRNTHE